MVLYRSFRRSSPSPHLRKKRVGWAGKDSTAGRSPSWTQPSFSVPLTSRFCATNLLSAPRLTWGLSQKVITNNFRAPFYAAYVPLGDTAANSTVTVTPVCYVCLRLNKPTLNSGVVMTCTSTAHWSSSILNEATRLYQEGWVCMNPP